MEFCLQCKQPCHPGQTILRALGNVFHSDHFLCATCGAGIGTGDFYESSQFKGAPVCPNCFQGQFSKRCGFCNQAITGTSISALNKQFHSHCFVCATCHTPLTGTFYENAGKPYCTQHYRELFCEKCMCCNKPIEGSSISALGGKWDAAHFVCHFSQCRRVIRAGETFYEHESKPYCSPEHLSMAKMELTKPLRAQAQPVGGSPYGQPGGSPYGQPGGSPYGQPGGSPYGQPGGSPYGQPGGAPAASPYGAPAASPYGAPAASPYGAPAASPYGQPGGAPAASPYGQPAASPYGAPAASPAASPYGAPAASPAASPYGAPAASPGASPAASPYGAPAASPYGAPASPAGSHYGHSSATPTHGQSPNTPYGQPSGSSTHSHSQPAHSQPAHSPYGQASPAASPYGGVGQSRVEPKTPPNPVEPELIGVPQPGAPIPKPISAQATLDQELDELDSLMESLDAEGKGAKPPQVQPKVAPVQPVVASVPQPVRSDASRIGTPAPQPVPRNPATASPVASVNTPPAQVKGSVVASVPPQPAVVPAPVPLSPPLPPEDEPLPSKPSRSMVSGASTIAELDDIDSFLSSLDDGKSKGKNAGSASTPAHNPPPKKGSKMEELNDLDKFMDDLIESKPAPKAAPEKKKPAGSTSRIDMNELDDLMNSLLN